MIISFTPKATERLFVDGVCHKQWRAFEASALRKLDILDAAHILQDLSLPPGNRLEALSGDRKGQWSIRINQQWRICFEWTELGPQHVKIIDYH